MHVDINSCFATIEQQANPDLRGKPTVVAAYTTGNGCILAASREAKRIGIKTGMQVREGWRIYPRLIVLPSDPEKYRVVNRRLKQVLMTYTDALSVESIDEMVMDLSPSPMLYELTKTHSALTAMVMIARDIKRRVREDIGEWISVSCGIAANRYLAKVASGLQKPDGLVWITKENIEGVFGKLALTDLTGIKEGNGTRLRIAGIRTPREMLAADAEALGRAFHSIVGYYWWQRLHGWEDGSMYKTFDEAEEEQKTFGQSYALPRKYTAADPKLWQIVAQLTLKMGKRLRDAGCTASGFGISLLFEGYSHWHLQEKQKAPLFADADFYWGFRRLLARAPSFPVRIVAIYCYDLTRNIYTQQSLLVDENKKRDLTQALDRIGDRFGDFVVVPGRMMNMEQRVLDRISFGGVGRTPAS
jgi:DNA polymerase-4